MRALSPATICHGPKASTSSSLDSAGCTITRTSNCRPTPREPRLSTQAHFPATPISISCWVTPPAFTQLQYLAGKHWVNNNYGFYVNDNWHVLPRLTLNLGFAMTECRMPSSDMTSLRISCRPTTTHRSAYPLNPDGTLNPASLTNFNGQPFYLNGIREAGARLSPWSSQELLLHLATRVGFAYDLSGNGKTVLRGGFGMFFERVQGNDVYNAALNPPFAYQPSRHQRLLLQPQHQRFDRADNIADISFHADQYPIQFPAAGDREVQPWEFSASSLRPSSPSCNMSAQSAGTRTMTAPSTLCPDRTIQRSIRQGCRQRQRSMRTVSHLPGLQHHYPGGEPDQFQLSLTAGRLAHGEPPWAYSATGLHLFP